MTGTKIELNFSHLQISTVLFIIITCNGDNIVYPLTSANDDQQPVTQPLHLPSFPVMTLIRYIQDREIFVRNKLDRKTG